MNLPDGLLPGLFRSEFSRMVAVISKRFGLQSLELAEDIVSDTFLQASETWKHKGVPENPTGWLYAVAKQKTLYHFRRTKLYNEKIAPQFGAIQDTRLEAIELDFSLQHIRDSQLQMLFAVCDPVIASEAQIALALRVLCGFGIEEIAEAFFTSKDTINKRMHRAKEKLRNEYISLKMPATAEIENRLDNVLRIIYLLFNEGYCSVTPNQPLRKDLCLEALRLGLLLADDPLTNTPKVNALIALMSFHASRLDARLTDENDLILYDQQDESLWNKELIARGAYFLNCAAAGDALSTYHLEAGIAFCHCQKKDTPEKWENILHYYDLLLSLNYAPGLALNRLYALYKAHGAQIALSEAVELQLINNHYYYTLLGELYKETSVDLAIENLQKALQLAKKPSDRHSILQKLNQLKFS